MVLNPTVNKEDEMVRTFFHAALLSATFLSAVPAHAQAGDVAAEISALRAELQSVNARLEAVESRASRAEAALAQAQTQAAAAAAAAPAPAPAPTPEIRFSGAPQIRAPGG
ncbi:MAG TPA: hypothetical protein VFO69_09135, partial [Allosphingosinicella sp.]|nr:hypothetical protein [Allosphingosinicella sp.]